MMLFESTAPFFPFSAHAEPVTSFRKIKCMKLPGILIASTSVLLASALLSAGQDANTLTDAEKAAGWQLLFNGTNFDGWHNFKKAGIAPGWEIKDGAMVDVQHGG